MAIHHARDMFIYVRARLAMILALLAFVLSAPAAWSATTPAPTNAQIQAAIKQVSRSKDLWATFNICNTKSHPNAAGIRAQMPGLGFRAKLSMKVQINYWSVAGKKFKPIPGALKSISLGSAATGLHQGGVTFRFAPHAGFLASIVTFDWTLGNKLIGELTRHSSKGHPLADDGDPPHFSAGKCVIS
jgi:hypothetical protein